MQGIYGTPFNVFGGRPIPGGLQTMPMQQPAVGALPRPLGSVVDWAASQLRDVAESQRVYEQYQDMLPEARERLGPAAEGLSDEELIAQMMTHDRFGTTGYLAPEEGFVRRDLTQGHDPALAAAEHRAFVHEAARAAPYGPLGTAMFTAAMNLATPAYAAYKASGLKQGSSPSLAQLVAGISGAQEAAREAGIPNVMGPGFFPQFMRQTIQDVYGR